MHLLRTSIFGTKFFAFCNDMDLFHMNPFSCSFQTLLYQTMTLGKIILLIHFSVKVFRKAKQGEGQQFILFLGGKKWSVAPF